MKYRSFGQLDFQVSALGFGAMRLPCLDNVENRIDEPEAIRMIRYAIDQGVNYIDTAWPYHGENSEPLVGKALRDGYRDKVKLATKMPMFNVEKKSDFDHYFERQLERIGVDHIDFYLYHGLNRERWDKMLAFDALEWGQKAVRDGKIGHLGFSFHDIFAVFKEIVDGWDGWEFCQIQYNFMNEQVQAGTKGLNYAAENGLAVVVMEPLLGGRLARAPKSVQAVWDTASVKRSPVDWALQWLWDKPEVSVVLSGMSNMEQVEQNLISASDSGIGTLEADRELFLRAREHYQNLRPIPCTSCQYCMPCPHGVDIPRNFEVYNNGIIYDNIRQSRTQYNRAIPVDRRAAACVECRECEEKCPQSIMISTLMRRVDKELALD